MAASPHSLLEPYRIAFEASPIGMSFVSRDWHFVECNSALRRMLGRSEEEMRSRPVTEYTHPDDRHKHEPDHERLLAGEIDSYQFEARYVHADGHVGWVNAHVGVLRDEAGEPSVVITLIEEITEQRRMREIHDRLLGLVLVGQGADALANTLSDLIQSPVALLDEYGQVMAEGRHADRRVKIPPREQLRGSEEALLPGITVRPLRLGDHVEGYLVAEDPPLSQKLSVMAIEQAASTFALQLAMTRAAEEVEHRLRGNLFDALLSDTPPDSASLVRWGQQLGHDLFRLGAVAFLRPVGVDTPAAGEAITAIARAAVSAAAALAPGSVVLPRQDVVLAALATDPYQDGRSITQELIARVGKLTGVHTVAGISAVVNGPDSLGNAVREAQQALEAVVALPRLGPVAAFGDLDLQHLLLGKKTPDDITRAARRTLGPLLESDLRHKQKLLTTLAVYLQSVGMLETTARRLGIHINTLRQRLERIEETLELDLQDARNRVNLQLALEVLDWPIDGDRGHGQL
jgi:PAS domain S-box-containing protein